MNTSETIIRYLLDTYQPEAIITYGSFADGSAGEHSDFDALVIAGEKPTHNASLVGGTLLDVFVYPSETFQQPYNPADFVQVAEGTIVLDESGAAERLKAAVQQYLNNLPEKTPEELRQEAAWCRKMLGRAAREDAEGLYRWHWLLTDSLEIYFDLKRQRYPGPKKALQWMAGHDPEGFNLYARALGAFSQPTLAAWVEYLEKLEI